MVNREMYICSCSLQRLRTKQASVKAEEEENFSCENYHWEKLMGLKTKQATCVHRFTEKVF